MESDCISSWSLIIFLLFLSCFKSSSSCSRMAFSTTDSWRDLSQETSEVTSKFHHFLKPWNQVQGQRLSLQGGGASRGCSSVARQAEASLRVVCFSSNYACCFVRGNCFTKEKYKLTIAFKYVGSQRYSYGFWGILYGLFHQRIWKLLKWQACMTRIIRTFYGFGQIEGIEVTLHHKF